MPTMAVLEANRVRLTPGERAAALERGAVMRYPWRGDRFIRDAAVWKSVTPDGKTWYVTNTSKSHQARPTLRGAISVYNSEAKGPS